MNEQTFSARGEIGVRTFGYTSQIIDPPSGRTPEMTPAGQARAAPRDRGHVRPRAVRGFRGFHALRPLHHARHLGRRVPGGLRQRAAHRANSEQRRDQLRDDPRHAHHSRSTGGRTSTATFNNTWATHGAAGKATRSSSRRRNLTDKTSIGPNGNGTRHSDTMKITERLTRVDPEMIEYLATVEDPITYTAPFTVRLMLTTQPNYTIYEYSCNEGNQAVRNALSGERAYERSVKEALAKGLPPPERADPRSCGFARGRRGVLRYQRGRVSTVPTSVSAPRAEAVKRSVRYWR